MAKINMMETVHVDASIESHLEDDEVQEVLRTGTDLRQYSKQIEKQLKEVENKSIQDYIKESQNIVSLHKQIAACDDILERMESMLLGFQSDLGSISSEIVSLQRKSISMSQMLHNRQAVRGQLGQFIEDVMVPESLILGILDSHATDKEFLTQLQVLQDKIGFVRESRRREVRSCEEVRENLERLKVKAVAKVRSYLLEQVYRFRRPMANYQVPQNNMLKFKFFFEFVLENEKAAAQEICTEYVDTLGKMYYSYFKSYSSHLAKLTYPYEALFRSEQYALVDNACREYLFVAEFFRVKGARANELFSQIMGKTLNLLLKGVESFANGCYDALALFLSAQLVLRYQLLCHKRAVPALDSYWDALQDILWPRFEYVLQLNIQSVKDCDPSKFSREVKPHYITRRYAEFSSAVVSVSESFPNEGVSRLLGLLLEEVQLFLLRMAAIFPARTHQLVFLINNYDMMLAVLLERTRESCKEVERLREELGARSSEYVEVVLSPHFEGLMQFVKQAEPLLERGATAELAAMQGKATALVESFCESWKPSLEALNKEIISSFPSLITGSSLLQLTLAQLLNYYERFHKLLNPAARAQLVNIHHIKVELKKYKTNFS